MSEPLIRARGLVKHYDDPRHPMRRFSSAVRAREAADPWHRVLDGVDIEIGPGETVGVLGRNGAGKSTLLAILAGARAATSGTVERRGRTVPILELGGGFDDNRTGRDNVVELARSHGMSMEETKVIVAEAEEFAEIGEAFDEPMRTHSSGMRSRVAFGAALALRGDLVMLDETLAVGDLGFRLRCYDLIRRRQREGVAFLLISHSPNTLANLCTRIVVLDKGRIVYDGAPAGGVTVYKGLRLDLGENSRSQEIHANITAGGTRLIKAVHGETVCIPLIISSSTGLTQPSVNLGLITREGISVTSISSQVAKMPTGSSGFECTYELRFRNLLVPGEYSLMGYVSEVINGEVAPVGYSNDIARIVSVSGVKADGLVDLQCDVRIAVAKLEAMTA